MKLEYHFKNSIFSFTDESNFKLEKCSKHKIKRLYLKYKRLYKKYNDVLQLLKSNNITLNYSDQFIMNNKIDKYNKLRWLLLQKHVSILWKK